MSDYHPHSTQATTTSKEYVIRLSSLHGVAARRRRQRAAMIDGAKVIAFSSNVGE
jgi:hypothetical protein